MTGFSADGADGGGYSDLREPDFDYADAVLPRCLLSTIIVAIIVATTITIVFLIVTIFTIVFFITMLL